MWEDCGESSEDPAGREVYIGQKEGQDMNPWAVTKELTSISTLFTSVQGDYGRGRLKARFVNQKKNNPENCSGREQTGSVSPQTGSWKLNLGCTWIYPKNVDVLMMMISSENKNPALLTRTCDTETIIFWLPLNEDFFLFLQFINKEVTKSL